MHCQTVFLSIRNNSALFNFHGTQLFSACDAILLSIELAPFLEDEDKMSILLCTEKRSLKQSKNSLVNCVSQYYWNTGNVHCAVQFQCRSEFTSLVVLADCSSHQNRVCVCVCTVICSNYIYHSLFCHVALCRTLRCVNCIVLHTTGSTVWTVNEVCVCLF